MPPTATPTPNPAFAPVERELIPPEEDPVGLGPLVPAMGVVVPGVYPGAGVVSGTKLFCQKMLLPEMVGKLANAASEELPAYTTSVGEQYSVQLARGSLNSSTESSATLHPVHCVASWLPLLRFLQAWLMATHSCSWNRFGLRAQLGDVNEGSVHPATYVFLAVFCCYQQLMLLSYSQGRYSRAGGCGLTYRLDPSRHSSRPVPGSSSPSSNTTIPRSHRFRTG